MTRDELRARIRDEVGRRGYVAVSSGELWAAFAAPGEDTALSFEDALRGFAAVNGWRVRAGDSDDTFLFCPAGPEARQGF